jgi:hypothetical protein
MKAVRSFKFSEAAQAVLARLTALESLDGLEGRKELVTNVDVDSSKLPSFRTLFCSSLPWLSIPTSSFVVLHRNT